MVVVAPTGMNAKQVRIQLKLFLLYYMPVVNSEESYKVSGGLHGVGASVVNALSEWLKFMFTVKDIFTINVLKNGGTPAGSLKVVGDC